MSLAAGAVAYHVLRGYAVQDSLPGSFVRACLCIAAWESNNFDPEARNRQDPGPWGSAGLWQLNSEAYPMVSLAQATNPFWSTQFWLYHQGAERRWLDTGGTGRWLLDHIAYLREWAPAVQGSDPWSISVAETAEARVDALFADMAEMGYL